MVDDSFSLLFPPPTPQAFAYYFRLVQLGTRVLLWSYGAFYSITTFIGGISPPLQIRQVARLRSTTSNLQVLSPTREEHTNNPVQKPNFRGHWEEGRRLVQPMPNPTV